MAATPRLKIPKKVTGSFQFLQPPGQTTRPAAAPPLTLQQQAQAELDPLLKRISDSVNARAQNAGKAISGYTNSLATSLAGTDYAAPYRGAEQQQAAVDSSLAQALAGGGLSNANDLQTRLAQIGDPSVAQAAQAVQGNATGNSNALLAAGSSNLGALISNAASAGSYGQKLPGIARLGGLQDLASANQGAASDIRDQTAQVETQLPTVLNSLRSFNANQTQNAATNAYRDKTLAASDKKTNAALILANGVDPATGTLTPTASKALSKLLGIDGLTGVSASAAEKRAHDQATEQQGAARITNTETNRTRQQTNSDRQYQLSWAKTYHYDPVTLKPVSGWHFDAKGNVVKNGAGAKIDKNHGLTANEVSGYRGTALTLAETAHNGGKDAQGNDLPAIDYNAAVLEAKKEGIPEWIYRPALDSFYKAGGTYSPVAGPPAPKR